MALRHAPTRWVRWWLRVVPLAVMAIALYPVAVVRAASPVLAIQSPADGSVSANPSPSFSGVTDDPFDEVALSIYEGPAVEGAPLQTLSEVPLSETWLVGPAAALPDGIYTAQAAQTNLALEQGISAPVTFTVDTAPPEVSLTPLAAVTKDAEVSFAGAAGALTGDSSTVKLALYAGGAPSGTPVDTVEATREEGNTWSVGPLPALADGTYTARAEQSDEAGNVGFSAPSTFTVDTVGPAPSLTPVATPSNDATPSLTGAVGAASGDLAEVRLKLYAGATASGSPLRTIDATVVAGEWNVGPLATLPDGLYTARAEQADEAGNVGFSSPSTFTVDTVAPTVSLTAPTSLTGDTTPTFEGKAGVAAGDEPVVQVKVYAGATVSGSPLQTIQATPAAGSWSATSATPLADGVYTVQAIQSDEAGNTGVSGSFKFRLDTTAPAIALSAPISGATADSSSQLVQGTAGTSEGDLQTIAVELFEGPTIGAQEPLEKIVVTSVAGHWSTTFGGLAEGVYTVQAEQSDQAGNTGKSAAVTFTLESPKPPPTEPVPTPTTPETPPQHAPPTVSFTWFPQFPHTGEAVSMVSNSSDLYSPIATLAWALESDPFQPGGGVFITTFTTPGQHAVRLRVTAADGLSGTVMKTVPVSSPPASLMQPFPIVRIAGTDTKAGARLKLITVLAPVGAHITVACKGRGCPRKPESRVASSHKRGVVLVEFHRFERLVGAGAVLEIRIWKPGEIGKYTRFQIHKSGLPQRSDSCLNPSGIKPMACPSS